MASRKRKSEVWEHFHVDPNDGSQAICNHCGEKRSRGKDPKNRSTTNLQRHLTKCTRTGHQESDGASTSTSRQATLAETLQRRADYASNSPRAQAINRAIGTMIAVDMRPYSVVEGEGFRDVVKTLDPRYRMPSRTFFADKMIPDLYEEVIDALHEQLNSAERGVSLTTDMWRSHQNKEYMCVTMHWSSRKEGQGEFKRGQALVSLQEFAESTTAVNIRDRLDTVATTWLPPHQCLLYSVSDNAANIKRCLIDAANDNFVQGWVPCLAHCLNLATRQSMEQRAVTDCVKVTRTLVSKVHNSQPVKRRFDELLNLHYPNQKHTVLVKDVETRWNSTLMMIESVLKYRTAVEAMANDRVMRSFPDFQRPRLFQHWSEVLDLLTGLVDALKPCYEATLMVSSDNSSISNYIPLVKGLSKQLGRLEASPDHAQHVGSTIEELQRQWHNRMNWIINPAGAELDVDEKIILRTFHASTILDPRYKMKYAPRGEDVRRKIKEAVVEIVMKLTEPRAREEDPISESSDDQAAVAVPVAIVTTATAAHATHIATTAPQPTAASIAHTATTATDTPPVATATRQELHRPAPAPQPSLSAAIIEAMSSSSSSDSESGDGGPARKCLIERELDVYLQQPVISPQADPLKYWSTRMDTFPLLAPSAAACLACPPSSVTSERMFSMAGQIVTKKRCSLKPENLERLAIIKVNKNLLKH